MIIAIFQVHDLEFAQIENEVVKGLKKGNESLKKLHQVSKKNFFSQLWVELKIVKVSIAW